MQHALKHSLFDFFCLRAKQHTGDGKFRHGAPVPTGKSLHLSEILALATPAIVTV
jgi:hypothetical protein